MIRINSKKLEETDSIKEGRLVRTVTTTLGLGDCNNMDALLEAFANNPNLKFPQLIPCYDRVDVLGGLLRGKANPKITRLAEQFREPVALLVQDSKRRGRDSIFIVTSESAWDVISLEQSSGVVVLRTSSSQIRWLLHYPLNAIKLGLTENDTE